LFNGSRKEYLNVLKPIFEFYLENSLKGGIKIKPIKNLFCDKPFELMWIILIS
jgi:hypothetical protein